MANVAYCSEWYNLNLMEKKCFLILLQQLQMKVDKTAFGLIEINFDAYTAVSIIYRRECGDSDNGVVFENNKQKTFSYQFLWIAKNFKVLNKY